MGAHLTGTRCTFRLWAPNASRITVAGSFNDWNEAANPLTREFGGIWSTALDGVHAGDEYLYLIDNQGGDEFNPGQQHLYRCDPWARAAQHSSGNGIIVDVAAELAESGLATDGFETPYGPDWLIYQAHIGSFTGQGDGVETGPHGVGTFAQFLGKLPYIRSLGFNAIALLPVHMNPGEGNEGYAPSHLFAPESSFGSALELRRLIRAAHDTGLAVLFDVVWNHMSDVDNRLWNFDGMEREGGIFFEDGERTPWGPRLAFWKREVRDFIVANARMCFEEYHADGLRIDAGDEIARDVLAAVVAEVRAEPMWSDKLLILEWTGRESTLWPALTEELRFDRVWALADPILFRQAVDAERASSPAERVESLLGLLGLPGASSRIRYLLGSHDNAHDNEGGERTGYRHFVELAGGRDSWHARAKARMGWALGVTLPGTPMCFMGAECHQAGYWHPRADANVEHTDHRFDWSQAEDEIGMQMRALVRDANQVWWNHPALREADVEIVHQDPDNGVVAFLRTGSTGGPVLTVVNAGESSWPDQGYRIPTQEGGPWHVVLDTQGAAYGGDGIHNAERLPETDGAIGLSLPRWGVVVASPARG